MLQRTRDEVLAAAAQTFPTEDPASIMKLLDTYGLLPHEMECERVQIAVLKLSEGNLDKLRLWIDAAKADYRDALYAAEYSGM